MLYNWASMGLTATEPFSLVVFGGSGHLAKMKLYPSLYVLALKNRLPKDYAVIGFARTEMSDAEFRALVEESIRTAFSEVTQKALTEFLDHVRYVSGEYDQQSSFEELRKQIERLEGKSSDWVRMMYLSVPPSVFSPILKNVCVAKIHDPKRAFRCIIEKPVGHDAASAEALIGELTGCFKEEDVFMLDHYLGKEAVRNIYYLRYANPILERLFKNTLIHHVEITAHESAGIENRAGYFEQAGALRDMLQSHLLLIMALLTMRLEGDEDFRFARLNALEQIYLPPAPDLRGIILQGQYEGYTKEEGVAKNSRVNTYCALQLLSRTSRWQGVPFFLRTGKRLNKKETRISVLFQEPHKVGPGATPNRLDIILQGEAGMRLYLQTKVGGTEPQFRSLLLEDPLVCYGDCLPEHALLLLEAIHGKQQWFLSHGEVRAAWRIIDPLQVHLSQPSTPLHLYTSGSNGPAEADAWIGKHGTQWMN